jgi:hypothetical protein
MSLPKIFIGGDSWACGEWPAYESISVVHCGIEDYFIKDGHVVFNTARGGASNKHSISMLETELNNKFAVGDLIVWVQTDPIRNLRPYDTISYQLEQAGGVLNLMKQILVEDYARLNTIAQRINNTIYLVGGLLSIQQDQLTEYPKLNCLVESWPKLLVGTKPEYTQPDWSRYSILDSDWKIDHIDFDSFKNTNMVREIVDELYVMNTNRRVYQDPIFYPNGTHPNREGHQILYNLIKEKLNL